MHNDNFYQCEAQPGIFSLSKENKEAQKRIASYNKELDELKNQRLKQEENNVTLSNKFDEIKNKNIDANTVTSNLYLRQSAKIDGEKVNFNFSSFFTNTQNYVIIAIYER